MKKKSLLLMLVAALGLSGFNFFGKEPPGALALIPRPVKVERGSGALVLKEGTALVMSPDASPDLISTGEVIREKLQQRTGLAIEVVKYHEFAPGQIAMKMDTSDEDLKKHGPEAYRLKVGAEAVLVARDAHGFFNAGMTLLQLVQKEKDEWVLPRVEIFDYPRFLHRGLHLDPARRFLEIEFVKRYVDLISQLKLNVLHFHLVDDQGWRLESRKFPKLHEVGSHGGMSDGYYTQDEIKDLVAYAQSRHVTVIPEIEMPGHCSAMLAAYPELSCSGEQVEVSGRWGIHRNAMCPCREETYEFADELLGEVASLFPSAYIHIGSDEVMPKDWLSDPRCQKIMEEHGLEDNRGLQSYFVGRVDEILKSYGKGMIGWDEIVGYAPEGALVQAWHNRDRAKQAVLRGNEAIVSPINPWYFDYPEHWWSMKDGYLFEPVPDGLIADQEGLIIGGEACMWGERAPQHKIDYKVYPRVLALSERLWSPEETRDFADFKERVRACRPWLSQQGVRFKPWSGAGFYPVITP